ncbi:PQQ-binding-like beta-propeller repeat protein [Promicromonospora sp. NPDC050249]|uniref:outer membrane protein assembly factor BamB family protein n=1 Tax=Promicromonospora sp. NPDC050249 TaxID=3154743 RepID=UPI00340FB7E0
MPRPAKQESVVFDLVEEHGPDGDAYDDANGAADEVGGGPDASAEPRPRPLVTLSRLSRRTWALTAVVAAVVAVTVVVVDLVRDHRRAELMRTSPVGVESLADPPAETWAVRFDTPVEPGDGISMDQQVVIMDGLLVVPPTNAQSYWVDPVPGPGGPVPPGFDEVVAIDPASGGVAWRVPLGERPTCGPTGYDASTSTEVLVCVQGADDAREVLTIAPDGSTRTRPAELAEGEHVFPGPDGTAVRTVRTGDPGGEVECDVSGTCSSGYLTPGRDVRVTAEDAGTGAERWTSTVAFDPMNSMNCQGTPDSGGWPTADSAMDPDVVTVSAGAETVVVDGCGVSATLSASGIRLDLVGGTGLTTPAWVTELGPGRFAVEAEWLGTTVVDETGKTLHTLDGSIRTEATSPDAPADLWFVKTTTEASGFEAVREDGSVVWSERYGQSVLLAGRDVVVVNRGNRVVGLERTTGAELWSWSSDDLTEMLRFRTLTDGETVALEYLSRDGSSDGLLVTLDLDTGRQLWHMPMTGPAIAVDGRLVEFTPEGVRGLG